MEIFPVFSCLFKLGPVIFFSKTMSSGQVVSNIKVRDIGYKGICSFSSNVTSEKFCVFW